MQNLGFRLYNGVVGALVVSPLIGGSMALCGYVYAKFKDLPPGQVALAFAVWHTAEAFFLTITATFSENKKTQAFIRTAVLITSSIIATYELHKQEILGPKMIIFVVAIRVIAIRVIFSHAFTHECKSDPIKMDPIFDT